MLLIYIYKKIVVVVVLVKKNWQKNSSIN
jgi:hypothetical protein